MNKLSFATKRLLKEHFLHEIHLKTRADDSHAVPVIFNITNFFIRI